MRRAARDAISPQSSVQTASGLWGDMAPRSLPWCAGQCGAGQRRCHATWCARFWRSARRRRQRNSSARVDAGAGVARGSYSISEGGAVYVRQRFKFDVQRTKRDRSRRSWVPWRRGCCWPTSAPGDAHFRSRAGRWRSCYDEMRIRSGAVHAQAQARTRVDAPDRHAAYCRSRSSSVRRFIGNLALWQSCARAGCPCRPVR
jgi:hypothetical protein